MKDKLTKHHNRRGHYTRRNALIVGLITVASFSATTVPFSVALTNLYSTKNTTPANNEVAPVATQLFDVNI